MHQYFSILSDRFFTEQTARGLYNVSDLTEVKIPVNMPGITDWKGYENISGRIQFENNSYNYVKMKITRKALYLMCIPDYQTTRLSNQNVIDAKQAKSVPVPKKEHVPYSKTTLSHKFNFAFVQFAFSATSTIRPTLSVQRVQRVIFHHLSIPDQPPRLSC